MAQIKNSLDLDNKQKRIEELEADMESPGFWDNPDKSQNAMKELKGLKDAFERYIELDGYFIMIPDMESYEKILSALGVM